MNATITTDERNHWEGVDSKLIRKPEDLPEKMIRQSTRKVRIISAVEKYGSRINHLIRFFYLWAQDFSF